VPRGAAMLGRMVSRSGALVFEPEVDGVLPGAPDPRSKWVGSVVPGGLTGKDVLDVGCWTGRMLRDLGAYGCARRVGMDIDGPWLDVARRSCPDVEFVACRSVASGLRPLAHSFHVVLFLETLEHLPARTEAGAMSALAQALRPGGTLVLSTPAAGMPTLLDPAWYLTGHRHYSLQRLGRLASGAGLVVERHGYSGDVADWRATIRHYVLKHVCLASSSLPDEGGRAFEVRSKRGALPQSIWMVAKPAAGGRGDVLPVR
jgi:SAM-dependent methyltransferase